jgi:hypothetical protein
MLRAAFSIPRRLFSQPAKKINLHVPPIPGNPDDYVTRRELNAFGMVLAEAIVNAVDKTVKTEIATVKTDIATVKTEIATVKTDIAGVEERLTKNINTLKTSIGALSDGLGITFEKMSATYIQDVMMARGIQLNSKIHHRYFHPDPSNSVNKVQKEFEIDLFCSDPLIMAECTTFLRKNELPKLQKFIGACHYVEKWHGTKPTAMFFVFGMNESIRSDVEALCQKNNIQLVEPSDL